MTVHEKLDYLIASGSLKSVSIIGAIYNGQVCFTIDGYSKVLFVLTTEQSVPVWASNDGGTTKVQIKTIGAGSTELDLTSYKNYSHIGIGTGYANYTIKLY